MIWKWILPILMKTEWIPTQQQAVGLIQVTVVPCLQSPDLPFKVAVGKNRTTFSSCETKESELPPPGRWWDLPKRCGRRIGQHQQ